MKNLVVSLISLVFVFIVYGFEPIKTNKKIKIVYLQPLGDVNVKNVNTIKKSIETFYGYKCIVNDKVILTKDLLTQSKTRYSANKILKKFNSERNLLIITEKDIATKKNGYNEWGVIGLGYRPGNTCVVSIYRIKNTHQKKFVDRLTKVTLHEIGHNLGLPHCSYSKYCLMNDANGTVKQIDMEKIWLCDNCKKLIRMN